MTEERRRRSTQPKADRPSRAATRAPSRTAALEAAVERVIDLHDDAPPAARAPERRAAPPAPPRRSRWAMAVVVAVAALLRLVMVLAPPADTYPEGPSRVANGVVVEGGKRVAGEELLRGSATKDFLEGTVLPRFQDYQVQPFWGGTLVVSVMAVPFFAALGPTIVALRLTAVVFAAVAAAAAFWILDRFASRRAAWIGGLLMAIGPPGLAVFGASAFGAEVENQTVALLSLAAFLAWVHGGLGPVRGFVAGCIAGFSIYCGYIVVPMIGLLALWGVWLDPRFLRRGATAWAVAGFLVGLWPSIYYNLTHAGGGLEVYGKDLADHVAPAEIVARAAEHAVDLVWLDLPGSFYLQQPLRFPLGRVVLAVFALCAVAAALQHRDALARALRPPWKRAEPGFASVHPTALFLAFLPVYALAYLVTDFRVDHERGKAIDYRYLLPFFPFLFLLTGIALDGIARRSTAARRAAVGTATALCALFLVSNLAYCRFGFARENWSTPGYSDVQFARSVVLRYGGDVEALAHVTDAVARKKPVDEQELFFFVVAQNYKYFLHPTSRIEGFDDAKRAAHERALAHLHATVPEPYRPFFEPLAPGERIFGHREIEAWRRWHAARDAGPR